MTAVRHDGSGTEKKEDNSGSSSGIDTRTGSLEHDGLLKEKMPKGAFLVGYADDVAVVITSRKMEEAEEIAKEVMDIVNRWMQHHELELAEQKTEVVVHTRKQIDTVGVLINLGDTIVKTKEAVKYLGVMLDTKKYYKPQIEKRAKIRKKL